MKKTILTLFSIISTLSLFGQAGELDLAFNGDGIYIQNFNGDGYAQCLALQDDGKILIGGYLSGGNNGNNDLLLMRLDTYGNPDYSFGVQGHTIVDYLGDDEKVIATAVAATGEIYTLSECDSANVHGALISKFTSSGQLDVTFGNQGHRFAFVPSNASRNNWYDLTLLPNGSLLAVGQTNQNGVGNSGAILKITPQGHLDVTFGTNGLIQIQNNGQSIDFRRIKVLANGDMLVLGSAAHQSLSAIYLAKLDANGNLVSSFGGNGVVILSLPGAPFPRDLSVKPDGKLLLTAHGNINGWRHITVVQLLNNGLLDQSFGVNGRSDVQILYGHTFASKTLLLPDGKILLTGTAEGPWNDDFAIARLQADGALDNSFHFDGYVTKNIGGEDDFVMGAVLQTDGRVVLVGNSKAQSDNHVSIARFLTGYNSSIDIDENENALKVSLYPNPASTLVKIKAPVAFKTFKIKIYTMQGALLSDEMVDSNSSIDISHLSTGLYVVSIQSSDGRVLHQKLKVLN